MVSEYLPIINNKPLLYTFRRCPYAIRARLAIKISGVEVEMHEVNLRDKPKALLQCSSKGTVPVIQFADGSIIEESLEIMQWALAINDPEKWMNNDKKFSTEAMSLISLNDNSFKFFLDRYKYSVRFPQKPASYYREQAEIFLSELNARLCHHKYLMSNSPTLPDMAIFPFIRQFANVDSDWFNSSNYSYLIKWLDTLLNSALFNAVMQK